MDQHSYPVPNHLVTNVPSSINNNAQITTNAPNAQLPPITNNNVLPQFSSSVLNSSSLLNDESTSISELLPDDIESNKARKIEFKNLIKEKVLKPSKTPQFDFIRQHHSHLVIRDSHYLLKAPTSFITCASCHRGRVLKISTIKGNSTESILNEIYSSIVKNPCSKKKQTSKEQQLQHDNSLANNSSIDESNSILSNDSKRLRLSYNLDSILSHNNNNSNSEHNSLTSFTFPFQPTQPLNNATTGNTATSSISNPSISSTGPISSYHAHGSRQESLSNIIPTFDQFFHDWEDVVELPTFSEKVVVKSLNASFNVTNFTLTTLFNSLTTFPTSLDFFLSLAIENEIGDNFFTKDTLIIPMPTYSCTLFQKEINKDILSKDEHLKKVINDRIAKFVNQQGLNLANFKVVIFFNFYQEGVPQRPQEHQAHKYVGNVYTLHDFNVNSSDSSLNYLISRVSFNHNYSVIDEKEEWLKTEIFNELVVSQLQEETLKKFHEYLLGSFVNVSVLERGPLMNFLPYTVDNNFLVTSSSSMFVVNFLSLKTLRVLLGENGLHMISYLISVKVNTKHNLYILKLLLERLQQQRTIQTQSQLINQSALRPT
ncbi:hypothetical protein WICMUC_004822 [Wickerhamomyces mucosus]|uniref:Uncharacterized protein n=1 Tax=Wickerhamomyces mucosus TaxID=1378264 RepID=A0A9P8PEM5_9ASCO|nr:hypothetical protein WICMUC_004822 [Wickerhamomyces mucosus]